MTGPIDGMHSGRTARSMYDTQPTIPLPRGERITRGADAWRLAAGSAEQRAAAAGGTPPVLVVDTYPGADLSTVVRGIRAALPDWRIVDVETASLPTARIDALIDANLTDDRVFGVISHAVLTDFYDLERLRTVRDDAARTEDPLVLVGWGAALAAPDAATIVVVDMARWEIQQRQRGGAANWHCDNGDDDNLRKYKRGFFVEWRVADRHKRALFDTVDFVVDGNAISPSRTEGAAEFGMITGEAFRGALAAAATRPLRVVPFFDPGVWGGQWMKSVIGLDPAQPNYAWCFDCVPEENSLLLRDAADSNTGVVELPALDLVFSQPRALLGEKTFARFGAEFPIRFDFLDTMGGGNLSLQVHPLTDYIQNTFGMHYTQDESYYMLDAGDDAIVYLGTREGIDRDRMLRDLAAAQRGERPFPAEDYVNTFPARKHDHFAIPAGTVHCSGENSMVLEISATPFIFTFKLWDWGRVGLDGIPRPVHLEHGANNIQWNRDTAWVRDNLVGQVEQLSDADGVVEERTGLHELEFIEVRRHWFTERATHHTAGTVNVLNLVEGDEVRVVSPDGAFDPFVVHYAETFIVPAAVGAYVIERTDDARAERFATVKAYVRGTERAAPTP
ncbi:mannose-6-phosphate isomerase [Microbacterium sp. zg.Y625]|uniref:class I mannose-6-phosphate isomerase n=1 Tax=Microbacterium jiangjiandongii TaxID=3049071 RepID=UPI00214B6AFB|nr:MULTISPECIES: class I mannose-6-phosphate isomerase [unclassified Microbacterium]MCR2793620.1 mannose-6-phosphate isomerase [Microbacterium sp. zg.Y625]WIM25969.1 class I mannose-6-phosphate isomerase [Microbacterium sp. zg-Y625]